MNATLQTALVGLLLAWSLVVMLRRFFPQTMARLRLALAAWASARGHVRLARWLQREDVTTSGCDSGCGSCRTGCASTASSAPAQPVQWRSPSSGGCH